MPGLRQLAAFEAVASELHFGRAAERLGVGQAAVSQLIRRLEQEHGVVLFERSSHHVALTAAGAELLGPAKAALAAGRAFDDAARTVAMGEAGALRVAPSDATARSLAQLVRAFARTSPHIQVEIHTVASAAKAPGLLDGTIDVAFVRAALASPGVRIEPIWTEPLVALVPAAVRASLPDGTVDPAVLAALPLSIISRQRHSAMHDELVDQARSVGIEPLLGQALSDPREGVAMIAAGHGWTLTAESIAPHHAIEGVTVLPFRAPEPSTTISLMWRATGASRHALAFVAMAREVAAAGTLPA